MKSACLAALFTLAAAAQGGDAELGLASWYGYPYHGRFAASGEIFDMDDMTAAHPSLPFNTRVRVVNLSNDKSVEVRIIDRGPFLDGRIIDLSRAAADSIGLLAAGTTRVRVEVLGAATATHPAVIMEASVFAVQAGAFRNHANAERFLKLMQARFGFARIVPHETDPEIWRVLVGAEATRDGADALSGRIRQNSGENNAFVVRLDPYHESDRPFEVARPGGSVATDGFRSAADR